MSAVVLQAHRWLDKKAADNGSHTFMGMTSPD